MNSPAGDSKNPDRGAGGGKGSAYSQIASHIADWIQRNAKPGDRLPTEPQLASRFGVSVGTIRRAVGLLVDQQRLRRVQGSGTFVEPDPGHLAVLLAVSSLCRAFDFQRPFAGQVLIQAAERGLSSRLYITDDAVPGGACRELLHEITREQVRAVVSLPSFKNPPWLEACGARRIPVLQHNPDAGGAGTVTPWREWVHEAVAALARAGRKRLAIISWYDADTWAGRPDKRLDAFREALSRHGLAFYPQWVRRDLSPHQPTAGWEEFREVWSAGKQRPDGLVVCDEALFRQAAAAVVELGLRVPRDLTIVTQEVVGSGLLPPFPTGRLAFDPARHARMMLDLAEGLIRGDLNLNRTVSPNYVWTEPVPTTPAVPVSSMS